jgi:hypothetical protein
MNRLIPILLLLAVSPCGCYYDQRVTPGPQPGPAPIVDPLPVPPVQEKPFIDGPESVEPGSPLWLTAQVEDGHVVLWHVEHPQGMDFRATEGGREFASAAPLNATEVRVLLAVAAPVEYASPTLRFVTKTIRVGHGPNPPPDPDPDPKPDPDPQPKPTDEPLRIVVVEESADRTPEQAAVYFDKPLREYVTSKGHVLEVWDDDSTATGEGAAARQAILDRAKGKPLPYLQVIGKTSGNIYSEGAPPKGDAAAMLKFIQGWESR